jgi:S-methylmethionine-dependent homocysteine/selenocysteine methylase
VITLLDGAMGTELQKRGARVELPLWSAHALMENPELVYEIHKDYLIAGADVITTNTFRTHRRSLDKGGLGHYAKILTESAVKLAINARKDMNVSVRIAGSISPLEDCYRPDLSPGESKDEFREIADVLAESGCDFLLIETMNNITELSSALWACYKTGLEYWASVNPSNDDAEKLLSGESVLEAMRVCEGEGASVFLVNCAGMKAIEDAIKNTAESCTIPFGGYANNGMPDEVNGWRFTDEISEEKFSEHCKRLLEMGATVIGGCCGMSPCHIKWARRLIDSL